MNAHHDADTPTLLVADPRSRVVRRVGYCRQGGSCVIESRINRHLYDGVGREVESWDPRLHGSTAKPNQATVYGLSGQPLLTDSVDAGWLLSLLNRAGLPHASWDGRGSRMHCAYDEQQRLLAVTEQAADASPRVVDRFTYGDTGEERAERNQCGRLIRHDDPAGSQGIQQYGLIGAVRVESRRFLIELETPDWPLDIDARDAWLEDQAYVTRHAFLPTGEVEQQHDAMGHLRRFGYDVAGQSAAVWLSLAGDGKTAQCLVSNIRYNAQGQVERETAGNGVISQAFYADEEGRLTRLVSAVEADSPLQDLNYTYDPVGNIIELEDRAQAVSWFNNQRIEPINRYRYDSLYQLVEATGWEVSTPSHGPPLPALLPTPLDPNQRRHYTQRFDYDAAGNLITRHHSGAPGFSMFTSGRSNRSLAQRDDGSLPGEPDIESGFDACGNQRELLRGQTMTWDVRNQLSRVSLVRREDEPGDDECYTYDRPGHRLRKVHIRHTPARELHDEVRYLPSLEIRCQADGGEHHVILAEAGRSSVRVLHWPQGEHAEQLRYNLRDHLGSTTLELDDEAGVLTQEHYYPFGGTACWAGQNEGVAKYKTVRYSGKERDATGLYYYGFRYLATWLQRWISPDPAGDEDGPNRYVMVGNNPINFIDRSGLAGEGSQTVQMMGGIIVMGILALMGAGLGWVGGSAQTGLSVGALVGGALFATMRWLEHRELRPEAVAAKKHAVDQRYEADVRGLVQRLSAGAMLTDEQTARFETFAIAKSKDADDVAVSIYTNLQGKTFGYTGPVATGSEARDLLSTQKNPVPALKRIGHSAMLLRDLSKAYASPSAQRTDETQFESGNFVEVVHPPKGNQTQSASYDTPLMPSANPAPSLPLEIDTTAITPILGNKDRNSRILNATLENLRAGRFNAVTWHPHRNRLWSADLSGFEDSGKRGAYRLMLHHEGGVRYTAIGIWNPHS